MAKFTVEITDKNFEEKVLKSELPVLVDFWAEWCGPCKAIGPTLEELAEEYQGKFVIGKMNVDDNSNVPTQFGIMNIPTLLFFKNGNLIDRQVGAVPKSALKTRIESALTK
ncbi:MAG: thioredoxin [Bacteroidia bacterium]|nr:thioredoxin [Bacteroidia bacterium]